MKNIFLFIISFLSISLTAQNFQFSVAVSGNGDELTLSVTNDGAVAEDFIYYDYTIYYNSAEIQLQVGSVATVDLSATTALGWDVSGANTTFSDIPTTDPDVPITHDRRVQIGVFDGFFTGTTLAPGQTVELATMDFNSNPGSSPMSSIYVGDVNTDGGAILYYGFDFDPHDINVEINEQILPITLSDFTATKGDKKVTLDWTTESEINGSHFEVERSQDGDVWNQIATVDAVGESDVKQSYQLIDSNLPLNKRSDHIVFYYRLKMVDKDGTFEYSDVRTARFDLDNNVDFMVYPNPARDELFVHLSAITENLGPATLNIIQSNGQLVSQKTLSSNDDIRVDISDLEAGIYMFNIQYDQEVYSQKVIKIQ